MPNIPQAANLPTQSVQLPTQQDISGTPVRALNGFERQFQNFVRRPQFALPRPVVMPTADAPHRSGIPAVYSNPHIVQISQIRPDLKPTS